MQSSPAQLQAQALGEGEGEGPAAGGHGHSHGPAAGHGHSHGGGGGGGHGHSHGGAAAGHGHSHGGQPCHGHGAAAQQDPEQEPEPELKPEDMTPTQAAQFGELGRLQDLAAEDPDVVRAPDPAGFTLVHWAAQQGHLEVLRWLLDSGAPVAEPGRDANAMQPLHWAAAAGQLEAVQVLLERGAHIDARDAKQCTPLITASQGGHIVVVAYLLRQGADMTLVDKDGDTAMHWAAYKGAFHLVGLLEYLGFDSGRVDGFGQAPLHLAAMRGNLEVVQYLCDADVETNKEDFKGRTPLKLAIEKDRNAVVAFLSRHEAKSHWLWRWVVSPQRASGAFYAPFVTGLINYTLFPEFFAMPGLAGMHAVALCTNLVMWVAFVLAWRSDPGRLDKDKLGVAYEDVLDKICEAGPHGLDRLRLCHTCHIQRPMRAKHCRVCRVCVHVFDHHCPFINNCVGHGNYLPFFVFVLFMTASLILGAVDCGFLLSAGGFRWRVFIVLVWDAVLALPGLGMLGLHTSLTASNITTNEMANFQRFDYFQAPNGNGYRNPFDSGPLNNALFRCLDLDRVGNQVQAVRGVAGMEGLDGMSAEEQEMQRLV